MSETVPPNRYAVPLDDLVDAVRVPVADQATGQPAAPLPASEPDEERRQLRLAGGA